tara:strand:+ start:568 stop:825 length:258 start_codon:yes stop_codon:yes gene_type:complete
MKKIDTCFCNNGTGTVLLHEDVEMLQVRCQRCGVASQAVFSISGQDLPMDGFWTEKEKNDVTENWNGMVAILKRELQYHKNSKFL